MRRLPVAAGTAALALILAAGLTIFVGPRASAAPPVPKAPAFDAKAGPKPAEPFAGHHDSNQPIHITADKLEVQQDNQVAIFTGHVDAIQGEVRLRADVLKIYYRQKAGAAGAKGQGKAGTAKAAHTDTAPPKPDAPAANPAGPGLSGGAITHIVADGHVFISEPGETASGDHGVYVVDSRIITLTGSKVVLTRGENVLQGTKAVMNLDTGISTLVPTAGGRVEGLFVPEKKTKPGEKPAAPPAAGRKTQ